MGGATYSKDSRKFFSTSTQNIVGRTLNLVEYLRELQISSQQSETRNRKREDGLSEIRKRT
jgi:hypothetical protein